MPSCWTGLPPEVRLQILNLLSQNGCDLAGFATVSREWHKVIEPYNFAGINLTPSRLSHSKDLLRRKRSLIHYIWFRLELQQYSCDKCAPDDSDLWGMGDANNALIFDGLQCLFSSLSEWEPSGDLIIDISVYSTSDSEHWFKYLDCEPDTPVSHTSFSLQHDGWTPEDDPNHGWIAGSQEIAPSNHAIDKVFDEIMDEGPFEDDESEVRWWQRLPEVPAVTGIFLRQQTRRRWKQNIALANMFTRFPNLKDVWYEPWRECGGMEKFVDKREWHDTGE